jgi:hypothetical protein
MSVARLALRIQDAHEDRSLPPEDARILGPVGRLLKDARRSKSVSLQQHQIVVLEYSGSGSRRRQSRDARK